MESFLFDWTELYPKFMSQGQKLCRLLSIVLVAGYLSSHSPLCDPFEGAQVRMSVTYSLGEEG